MVTAEARLKILIIDDEIDIRERLKRILERRGYSVLTAEDGLDGLRKVKEEGIDIVYCDIVMPKMDGLEFLKNIREFDLKAEVIMVTGHSTMDRCVESIEQNACGYLTKPLRVVDILNNLSRAERRITEKKEMLKSAFFGVAKFKKDKLSDKLPH